ncbi:MAG: hypothetical protein LBH95_06955 [Oscillospiraceae bacterium]|jgi:hypothetical protein|nr:hypothetical protein [Oscillospiraceae bacterium]
MKTKRTLIAAVLIAAALAVPALAATFTLGAFTAENSDTQKGWASNGTDDKETNLSIETLTGAKTLVLELSAAPTGGMQIIWQGDGDSWTWNQTDGVLPDTGTEKTTLRIDLASTLKNYDKFKASTKAKIFIGYYSNNIADLGITRAYLDGVPSGMGGTDGNNARTGENPAAGIAAATLLVTLCAAAFLARRIKTR